MPDLISFLLEVAARSSLVLGLTFALLAAMRRASASQRHLVLLLGLLMTALVPAGLLLSPRISWTIAVPQSADANGPAQKVTAYLLETGPHSVPPAPPAIPEDKPSLARFLTPGHGLIALLAAGMLAQAAMLGRASAGWRKIERQAAKVSLPDEVLQRVRAFAGAKTVPPLFASARIAVPVLSGWRRPVIILPAEATRWPSERLAMALCHELAHFRRGDFRLLPLVCVLRITYWWHPLVWLALGRLRREREQACDDLVLNQNFRATDYADLIVSAARQAHDWHGDGALAMASSSSVGGRIGAILNPCLNRRAAGRATVLVALPVALAFGWFFTAAQVRAEDAPVPSPVVVTADASLPSIRLEFKLIEIDGKIYTARQTEIDAAVATSDLPSLIKIANHTPGISLLSAPTVLTRNGLKADIGMVREMPYATRFDRGADGKIYPADFKTRDVGLSLDVLPTLEADQQSVQLKFTCKLTSFVGWQELPSGGRLPIFNTASLDTQELIGPSGAAVWVGAGPIHDPGPTGNDTSPKRILLLVNARPVPPSAAKPASPAPVKTTGTQTQVVFHFALVSVDEKAYEREAPAMDEAVRNGNLHFFDNPADGWILRTADLWLRVGQPGWYSEGTVQSYVDSSVERRDGKPVTVLQAKAEFLGLNADFKWSKDRRSIDSAWSITDPAVFRPLGDKARSGHISPNDLPEARFHVASYADKGWDMTPGKEHAFWVGETLGVLKNIPLSMPEMIKKQKPSRLAVFMTARPVTD